MTDVKQALDGLNRDWETFKKENDSRLEKIEKGVHVADDLTEKVEKINKGMTEAEEAIRKEANEKAALQDRLEQLEAKASIGGITVNEQEEIERKHADVFVSLVRTGMQDSKLADECKELEAKAVSVGTASAGGYAVPEEISRMIEKQVNLLSPVRRLVKVVRSMNGDYKELVNIGGAAAAWVGETGTRSETATSSFIERATTHGELYAYPKATKWSLNDVFFDVEQWIADEVAEQFAISEGTAVISGNGTSKPTGILNTTPVATDDNDSPLRAAAAIEYHDNPVSPSALSSADAIIDLVYRLKAGYRNGAVFCANTTTQGAIRKLKDTTNQYLWQPSYVAGQPSTLLGYALETWENLADVGGGNFPVLFGNFRRGYVLNDIVGTSMVRDEITTPGYVKFYVAKRLGGCVLNNEAIKALRT